MPAPTLVPITPSVLAWAMEQAGVTEEEVAERCRVGKGLVAGWLAGEAQPTKTHFNNLVSLLKRPTAFFFLPEPPDDAAVPASFRHPPGDDDNRRISVAESNAVRTARRLQRISRWILTEEAVPPPKLPEATMAEGADAVADRVRVFLGWSSAEQRRARDPSAVVRLLRPRLEELGFLMLHLPLGKGGCRGFSLYDPFAPVIAINTAYNPAARVFSYGHELGHLVLHTDGICTNRPGEGVERWCEEFSAAFLMPRRDVADFVAAELHGSAADFRAVRRLAARFKVSLRAAALRLIRLNYAKANLYEEVDEAADLRSGGGGAGGATSPEIRLREWGQTYPRLLLDAEEQSLLTRQDVLGDLIEDKRACFPDTVLAELERLARGEFTYTWAKAIAPSRCEKGAAYTHQQAVAHQVPGLVDHESEHESSVVAVVAQARSLIQTGRVDVTVVTEDVRPKPTRLPLVAGCNQLSIPWISLADCLRTCGYGGLLR